MKCVCSTAGTGVAHVSDFHCIQKYVSRHSTELKLETTAKKESEMGRVYTPWRPFSPRSCFCAERRVERRAAWTTTVGRGRRAKGTAGAKGAAGHRGVSSDAPKGTHAISVGGIPRRNLFSWRVGRIQRCFRIPRIFFHGGWFNMDHPCFSETFCLFLIALPAK